ncbi:MAG: NADPH-dependent reductase [Eubacterium sp.]|jgi:multimeric flavodoxin WrbA|nr:NADPH-dependent reductase [Eubacterium sp.]
MKILVINGSFRRDGNTQRILELFKEEYLFSAKQQHFNVEFETIFLAHENIAFCRGCRVCFDKGEEKCPLKDEVLSVRSKIDNSDAVVLASPVYVEDVNGFMKNWIDRMAFNNHRPAFCGKPAVVIATSGAYSSDHTLKTMIRAFIGWGGVVVAKDKFITGALTAKEDLKKRYAVKIKYLAEKLHKNLTDRKGGYPSLYSLVAFRVQQKYWQKTKNINSFDYTYWRDKGWLKNSCNYYTAHGAGFIKTKAAGFFGRIISQFFG